MKDMNIKSKSILAASLLMLSAPSFADQGTDAISALADTVTSYISAAWPVAVLAVTAFIGMKLFKKFANKAT